MPFFLIIYSGFVHAFETDHILAVSNVVSNRQKSIHAIKDGMYWGFGHTSTLILVGMIVLLLRLQINERYFDYFEQMVGLMLVMMGFIRLKKLFKSESHIHQHSEVGFLSSYSVGLVHGLAGSGALLIMVMSQAASWQKGIMYLIIYGLGSVLGMMFAAGVISLPFGKKFFSSAIIQKGLVWLSSLLCIGYGLYIIISRFNLNT